VGKIPFNYRKGFSPKGFNNKSKTKTINVIEISGSYFGIYPWWEGTLVKNVMIMVTVLFVHKNVH